MRKLKYPSPVYFKVENSKHNNKLILCYRKKYFLGIFPYWEECNYFSKNDNIEDWCRMIVYGLNYDISDLKFQYGKGTSKLLILSIIPSNITMPIIYINYPLNFKELI